MKEYTLSRRNLKRAMLAGLIAPWFAFIGCGKKDSGGSGNVNPGYASCVIGQPAPVGYVCVNGQLIPNGSAVGSLLNNVEFNASYMNGVLSISSSGGNVGGLNPLDPKAIIYYSGPITLQGTMSVDPSICTSGLTVAVGGTYTVTGSGMMSSGRIYQLNLTAMGASTLTIQGSAVVYNPSGLERDAMGNKISLSGVAMVNGMSCGVIYTY
jgi:hypothetical protein